jgi:hypothetical protein
VDKATAPSTEVRRAVRRLDVAADLRVDEGDSTKQRALLAGVVSSYPCDTVCAPGGRDYLWTIPSTPTSLTSLPQRRFAACAGRARRLAARNRTTIRPLLAPRAPGSACNSAFRDDFQADRRSGAVEACIGWAVLSLLTDGSTNFRQRDLVSMFSVDGNENEITPLQGRQIAATAPHKKTSLYMQCLSSDSCRGEAQLNAAGTRAATER